MKELTPVKRINAAIFDVDGTLIDSNNEHAKSWNEAFNDFGIHTKLEDIKCLIGMGSEYILSYVLKDKDMDKKSEQINSRRKEIFRKDYLNNLKAFTGISALFEQIKLENMKIILATSSEKDLLDVYVHKIDSENLIDGVITADDVQDAKPSPEVFEVSLKKYQLEPNDAVIIGDSPYDIISAKRAGLQIIALLTGGYTEEKLKETGADEIFKNIKTLYENFNYSLLSK